jgi:hypothetical protein
MLDCYIQRRDGSGLDLGLNPNPSTDVKATDVKEVHRSAPAPRGPTDERRLT